MNKMDESDVVFYCGQSVSLTSNLRGIVQDYGGYQFINELLQNADDAGAKKFCVLLDRRKSVHETKSLLSSSLSEFQGPAIYQYCDSSFTENDFKSIQRVGDGLKRGDITKTGQFGLGFNSCYHVTDLPMFVSGKYLVMFDPHEKYLPQLSSLSSSSSNRASRNSTGLQIDLMKEFDKENHLRFTDKFPDQMSPFVNMFGFDGYGNWNSGSKPTSSSGTIFRFPLRSAKVAAASDIKKVNGVDKIDSIQSDIIEPFLDGLSSKLLFLRSVEEIQVYVWHEGMNSMEIIASAQIIDKSPQLDHQRSAINTFLSTYYEKTLMEGTGVSSSSATIDSYSMFEQRKAYHIRNLSSLHLSKAPAIIYPIRIRSTIRNKLIVEDFVVSSLFGNQGDVAFCISEEVQSVGLILTPFVSIAARIGFVTHSNIDMSTISGSASLSSSSSSLLSTSTSLNVISDDPLKGKVYCMLPTSIDTNLPIHINARWELTRDRNHLISTNTKGQSNKLGNTVDQLRNEWNYRLSNRLAATAYARLIHEISLSITNPNVSLLPNTCSMTIHQFYRLFPNQQHYDDVWISLVASFYAILSNSPQMNLRNYIQYPSSEIKFLVLVNELSYNIATLRQVKMTTPSIALLLPVKSLIKTMAAKTIGNGKDVLSDITASMSSITLSSTTVSTSNQEVSDHILEIMQMLSCPISIIPNQIVNDLMTYGDCKGLFNSSSCRKWLRGMKSNLSDMLNKIETNEQGSKVEALLRYILSDLDPKNVASVREQLLDIVIIPSIIPSHLGDTKVYSSVWSTKYNELSTLLVDVQTTSSSSSLSSSPSITRTTTTAATAAAATNHIHSSKYEGKQLFRIQNLLEKSNYQVKFVDNSVLNTIWPFISALGYCTFNLKVFLSFLPVILPSQFNSPRMDLSTLSLNLKQVLLDWIYAFWNYVITERRDTNDIDLQILSNWSLLPVIFTSSNRNNNSDNDDGVISTSRFDRMYTKTTHLIKLSTEIITINFTSELTRNEEYIILQSILLDMSIPILSLDMELSESLSSMRFGTNSSRMIYSVSPIHILCAILMAQIKGKNQIWNKISDEHRIFLLDYLTQDMSIYKKSDSLHSILHVDFETKYQFVKAIDALKSFPLFIKQLSSNADKIKFTSLSSLEEIANQINRKWFTLPESDSFEELSGGFYSNSINNNTNIINSRNFEDFLERPNIHLKSLYSILEIIPLPREVLFVKYILPPFIWQLDIHPDARMVYLNLLKGHYSTMKDKIVEIPSDLYHTVTFSTNTITESTPSSNQSMKFGLLLSCLPLFEVISSDPNLPNLWISAKELKDPRIPLFQVFYKNNFPNRFLSTEVTISTHLLEWYSFFELLGMTSQVSRSALLDCAKKVTSDYLNYKKRQPTKINVQNDSVTEPLKTIVLSANIVSKYLFENYVSLVESTTSSKNVKDEEISAWLKELGSCYIAEIWSKVPSCSISVLSTERSNSDILVPYRGAILPSGQIGVYQCYCCSWSVLDVVKDHYIYNIPIACVKGLGANSQPTIENVINQISFLCKLPNDILSQFGERSRLSTSEPYEKGDRFDLCKHLEYIYDFLGRYIETNPNGRSLIRASLIDLPCIYISETSISDKRESSTKHRTIIYNRDKFIRPNQCFSDSLIEDIRPYAYRLSHVDPGFLSNSSLVKCLNIQTLPTLDQVSQWSSDLYRRWIQSGNKIPLTADELSISLAFVRLVYMISQSVMTSNNICTIPSLYIPDRNRHLIKVSSNQQSICSSLFYDDAPWLEDKIDTSLLPLIHSDIDLEVAKSLGLQSLSQAVTKVATNIKLWDENSTSTRIPDEVQSELKRWQVNIGSPAFQGALRRAIDSHSSKSNHTNRSSKVSSNILANPLDRDMDTIKMNQKLSKQDLNYKLSLLSNIQLLLAEHIQLSYYVDIYDEQTESVKQVNVTKQSISRNNNVVAALVTNQQYNNLMNSKSQSIQIFLQTDSNSITAPLKKGWDRKWLTPISLQINEFLRNSLTQSSLIPEFILCDTCDDIMEVLSLWEIPITNRLDLILGNSVTTIESDQLSNQSLLNDLMEDSSEIIFTKNITNCTILEISNLRQGDIVYFTSEDGGDSTSYTRVLRSIGKIDSIIYPKVESTESANLNDNSNSNHNDELRIIVEISPDHLTRSFHLNELWIEDTKAKLFVTSKKCQLHLNRGLGNDLSTTSLNFMDPMNRKIDFNQYVQTDYIMEYEQLRSKSALYASVLQKIGKTLQFIDSTPRNYKKIILSCEKISDDIITLESFQERQHISYGFAGNNNDNSSSHNNSTFSTLSNSLIELKLLLEEIQYLNDTDLHNIIDKVSMMMKSFQECIETILSYVEKNIPNSVDMDLDMHKLLRFHYRKTSKLSRRFHQDERKEEEDDNYDDNDIVDLVEYHPIDKDWEESEQRVLHYLEQKYDPNDPSSMIHENKYESEPDGIDSLTMIPMGTSSIRNQNFENMEEVEVGVQTRQGYDLIRVGNFAEKEDMLPDIAFFHHRITFPEAFTPARQTLLRQCCGILREVSNTVFNYDAVFITLFYQGPTRMNGPMPVSRFIRQKILLNIAPIDEYIKSKNIQPKDVSNYPFAYSYFYGLLVHKLAHFFDVVHGTRHDFFMTEYRCHFMLNWISLLDRHGFDPEDVSKQTFAKNHLYEVVS